MKKAFLSLLLMVLLLGLLTGCCSHEFAPADCEHPETCQKCGETQGETLGHDWLDATCDTAQTCTHCGRTQGEPLGHTWSDATCDTAQTCARCGEVQGEALGHDFGTWTFTDTTMTHTCQRCDLEDTQELDRTVQLGSYLAGHWDLDYIIMNNQSHSSFNFAKPYFSLDFQEDGTVSGDYFSEAVAGTWGFQLERQGKSYEGKYTEGEEFDYVNFYLDLSDDIAVYCEYQVRENPRLFLILGDEVQICLLRDVGMDAKLGATAWSSDFGYSLIFHEDHTFTANLSGDTITGEWATRPFWEYSDGTIIYSPFMWFERDGETISLSNLLYPETEDETDQDHFTPGQMVIYYNNREMTLEPTTVEAVEAELLALEMAPQVLVGTWTATSYRPFNDNSTTTDLEEGYSITFFEDSTFTGFVGRNITGVWQLHPTEEQNKNGTFFYRFYINEDKTEHYAVLHHYDDSDSFDTIWFYPDTSSSTDGSYTLTLTHYPELWQDTLLQGRELVIGSYTSTAKTTYSDNGGEDVMTKTKAYTIVFREDGTFSGQLDVPVSGTWEVDHYDQSDDAYRVNLSYDQDDLDSVTWCFSYGYLSLSLRSSGQFYQFWNDQVDHS